MSITSSEGYTHREADLSSDLGQKVFVRRCEEKSKQRGWFSTSTSTMDTLSAYPFHATDAPSIPSVGPLETLGQLESPRGVCTDACEGGSVVERNSAPIDESMNKVCTIGGHQGLPVNTMETFGTLESLPSVCYDEGVRQSVELVRLKNSFIDFDDVLHPDYELLMQPKCLSDPAGGRKMSTNSSASETEYGATLRQRASRLREMLQSISPDKEVRQKRVQQSVVGRDATVPENCHSKVTPPLPTWLGDTGRRGSTMALVPSCEGDSKNLGVGTGQANVQRDCFAPAVTTLMVCNLPCKLSSEGLTHAVDELGFRGMYDLIYVPKGAKNFMGYGFVNFFEPYAAARFAEIIGTHRFLGNPNKQAYCKLADHQGLQRSLRHIYRGSNYRRRAQLPVTK